VQNNKNRIENGLDTALLMDLNRLFDQGEERNIPQTGTRAGWLFTIRLFKIAPVLHS
jgi:hypothetical protein